MDWSKDEKELPSWVGKPTILKRKPVQQVHKGSNWNILLQGVREYFLNSRTDKDEEYLKPLNNNLPDLTASKGSLDNSIKLANALYLALEAAGHRVMLAPNNEPFPRDDINKHEPKQLSGQGYEYPSRWSTHRITMTYVGPTAIGPAIIEMSEEVKRRYVNGKYVREEKELALCGLDFGDVDMEVADRIDFELFLVWLVTVHIRQL